MVHSDKPSVAPVHASMVVGGCNVDILLAGQTGVGRSTLINMITGATNGSNSKPAARVSNDVRPCAIETTMHTAPLEDHGTVLQCRLWDTRGLDEAMDHPNLLDTAANWLRQQGFALMPKRQSERDLRNICRKRVNDLNNGEPSHSTSAVVLMWCIHASKIDVPIHWRHFRDVYVEYCDRRVKPVVVITQLTSGFAKDWEKRCRGQLGKLNLGMGLDSTGVLLVGVRRYRDISSQEYTDDSMALKDLIFRLSGRA